MRRHGVVMGNGEPCRRPVLRVDEHEQGNLDERPGPAVYRIAIFGQRSSGFSVEDGRVQGLIVDLDDGFSGDSDLFPGFLFHRLPSSTLSIKPSAAPEVAIEDTYQG